jgi:ribulose-5-phosphate 4-epimerase/fuculose-1-phosphate aldolase
MGRNLICAAYMIRHAVHTARPDIMCVAHSHSIYGRAFSTLGRNLNIITQDTCAYYNDIVLYNSFKGVVLGADEGEAITKALASKKVAILQNHGLLTCAKTIESTVFWFKNLESCFHAQLLADAAAGGRGGETVKLLMRMRLSHTTQLARSLQDGFKPNRCLIVWNVVLSSRALQIADIMKE